MLPAPPRLQQQSTSDVAGTASSSHRCPWIRPANSNAEPTMLRPTRHHAPAARHCPRPPAPRPRRPEPRPAPRHHAPAARNAPNTTPRAWSGRRVAPARVSWVRVLSVPGLSMRGPHPGRASQPGVLPGEPTRRPDPAPPGSQRERPAAAFAAVMGPRILPLPRRATR